MNFDAMVQIDALGHAKQLNSSIKSSLIDAARKLENAVNKAGENWKDGKYQDLKAAVDAIASSLIDTCADLDQSNAEIDKLAVIVKKYNDQKITSVSDI